MRIDVFRLPGAGRVSLMVSVAAAGGWRRTHRSLQSVGYVRPMAYLKHVGTFAQIRYGDQSAGRGFDDAVFVGPDTAVLETTIANIGVAEAPRLARRCRAGGHRMGSCWPWPPGVRRDLGTTTHAAADLPTFDAAFVVSSTGLAAVRSGGPTSSSRGPRRPGLLAAAHDALPWDQV